MYHARGTTEQYLRNYSVLEPNLNIKAPKIGILAVKKNVGFRDIFKKKNVGFKKKNVGFCKFRPLK